MSSALVNIIGKLEALGYDFYVDGAKIKYRYTLPNLPPAEAGALLSELRTQRNEAIEQLKFKIIFNKLSEHLRQRNYTPGNMARLKVLSNLIDKAWERLDYGAFQKGVTAMMAVPGKLKAEGHKPIAAKIYSHILKEEVWIITHPSALSFVPQGVVIYQPSEIQSLRGASREEIQRVHMIKKEFGGVLISAKGGQS